MKEENSNNVIEFLGIRVNKHIIMGAIAFFLILSIIPLSNMSGEANIDDGYKSEEIQFKKFTIKLTGSEYIEDRYRFHFEITNTSDFELNVMQSSFKILTDDKLYSAEIEKPELMEINPGVTTTGTVDFIMNEEDVQSGESLFGISYGSFFGEDHEFVLTK